MEFNWPLFITALGLALVIESLPWLVAPDKMREALFQLLKFPSSQLRFWGAGLLVAGVFLVWLSR